jgi:hypothetical protein
LKKHLTNKSKYDIIKVQRTKERYKKMSVLVNVLSSILGIAMVLGGIVFALKAGLDL